MVTNCIINNIYTEYSPFFTFLYLALQETVSCKKKFQKMDIDLYDGFTKDNQKIEGTVRINVTKTKDQTARKITVTMF